MMVKEWILRFTFLLLVRWKGCICADNNPDPYEATYGKVIFVSMIFRHGNRTILNPYPNDPYQNESYWPEGLGQLTKAGKLRAFELGKWTREYYNHLIMEQEYSNPEEIVCMNSTNLDRALMSAELFLAGFYPPSKEEMWNENNLVWQPMPIHRVHSCLDNVIATEAHCPKYNLEVDILSRSAEYAQVYRQNQHLFEHVSKYSGRPMPKDNVFLAIQNIINVYTCLDIEENRGLTLPSWTEGVYPEPMRSMAYLSFSAYTQTPEMKRLTGGPILKILIEDMKRKIRDSQFKRIFQFYSGHDTGITALLNTLNMFDGLQPPYSTALMVELRQKGEQYFVTIFYRNSTETAPYFLDVPNCGNPCTLNALIETTRPLIPIDWDKECQIL